MRDVGSYQQTKPAASERLIGVCIGLLLSLVMIGVAFLLVHWHG